MKDKIEELNLDGLTEIGKSEFPGGDGDGLTEKELQEHGREILWENDELPGGDAQNVAYSLRRMDAGLSELLEISERQAIAAERIADALGELLGVAVKAFSGD